MKLLNVNWIPSTYLNIMRYIVGVVLTIECLAVLRAPKTQAAE